MKTKIATLFLLFFCLFGTQAYPYWIWNPKTGTLVNPKYEVKPTPKDQFEFAKSFIAEKKYPEAKRELKKLLKAYPKSFEASESQYLLGKIEETLGNPYEAYQAYQKVIDKYPFSERIQEINELEYNIGEKFMLGEKRKALGMVLPVENPAVEIFSKVIENSTYGPLAPKAQYKLALVLKSLLRYYESEEAFNKVISNYPTSEWADAAKFQIAAVRAATSRGPQYDQGAAGEAKQKFEDFVREHPDAILSKEAEKNIELLNEKEAESSYNIARFYEKQKQINAAQVYYQNVIDNYPNSNWAAKALSKMQALEKKK